MRLIAIFLHRDATGEGFHGNADFSDTSGNVTVELDPQIVNNMLLVYDTAITGIAARIADELQADSVKRKGK